MLLICVNKLAWSIASAWCGNYAESDAKVA